MMRDPGRNAAPTASYKKDVGAGCSTARVHQKSGMFFHRQSSTDSPVSQMMPSLRCPGVKTPVTVVNLLICL